MLLKALLVNALLLFGASYAASCNVDVSLVARSDQWDTTINNKKETNTVLDIKVKNTGQCKAIDIGVTLGLSAACRIVSSWNLDTTTETTLITGYGQSLSAGATYSNAGFIVACTNTGSPVVSITLFGVNCDPSCSPTPTPTVSSTPAPTPSPTPAPTPAPTPSPTPAPTPSPTPAPTSAPTPSPTPAPHPDSYNGQLYVSISASTYSVSYAVGTDFYSGGTAYNYASSDCANSGDTNCDIGLLTQFSGDPYGAGLVACVAIAYSNATTDADPANRYIFGTGSATVLAFSPDDAAQQAGEIATTNCRLIAYYSGWHSAICTVQAYNCYLSHLDREAFLEPWYPIPYSPSK